MGKPPVESGADQFNVTWPFPRVAESPTGPVTCPKGTLLTTDGAPTPTNE
jgi:hypothetical protein